MRLETAFLAAVAPLFLLCGLADVGVTASLSPSSHTPSSSDADENSENISASAQKNNVSVTRSEHTGNSTTTNYRSPNNADTNQGEGQNNVTDVTPRAVTSSNGAPLPITNSNRTDAPKNTTVYLRGIAINYCYTWTCRGRCFQKTSTASVSESPLTSPSAVSSAAAEDSTTKSSGNETRSTNTFCRCDQSCVRLGDCCVDFFSFCLNITDEAEVIKLVEHALFDTPTASNLEEQFELNVTRLIVTYGSCVVTPEGEKFTMISSCPQSFADPAVVTACSEAEKHPNLQPYSDEDNMALTFRNVECARCHSYNMNRLKPWLLGVSCPNTDSVTAGQSSSEHNSYLQDLAAAIQSGHCIYIYRAPEHARTQPRSCLPLSSKLESLNPGSDAATAANVSQTDDTCTFEDMLLCKAYSYQTFSADNEEVKNPHCLKCMTGLTPVSVELPCARESNRSIGSAGSSGTQGGILALFSRDSAGAGSIVVNGRQIPASLVLCRDDQVFDHVFLLCRTLFCPVGFRPVRGQCSLVDHYLIPAKSQIVPQGTEIIYVTFDLLENVTCGGNQALETTFRTAFRDAHDLLTTPTLHFSCVSSPSQHDRQESNSSDPADRSVSVTIQPVSNLSMALSSLTNAFYEASNFVTSFVVKNYDKEPKTECRVGNPELIHQANISKINGRLYVNRSYGPLTQFYPLTNTVFKIDLTKSNPSKPVYISLVCVQPQMNSSLNCSSVAFTINRTRVENGTLFITNTDLSYPQSQYEIHDRFVLVCSDFENLNDFKFFSFSDVQYYLSWACSLTSVLFLMTSLVAFVFLPYLRTLAGHMTASLAASLAIGQLLILVDFIPYPVVCIALASISHFCWLAAFTWMTALAVHMTRTFFGSMATNAGKQKPNEVRKDYKKYCIGGWGVPALLVGVLLTLDLLEDSPFKVGYGTPLCGWMRQSYVFLVPVAVALALNVVCFFLTLVSIERTMRASRAALTHQQTGERQRLLVYSKMMSAMGFTWIAGFLASFTRVEAFWWVYIVLNGLQGTFIAFSFVLNARFLRFVKTEWSATKSGGACTAGRCWSAVSGSDSHQTGTGRTRPLGEGHRGLVSGKTVSCIAGRSASGQCLSGSSGGSGGGGSGGGQCDRTGSRTTKKL